MTVPPRTAPLRQAVYRRARRVRTSLGTASASQRMLPDFLIVGAQRCGTTTLFKTLAEHPQVLVNRLVKGVHYFDTDYTRGLGWYRGHFPTRARAALAERSGGRRVVTGEASPYYMFHPAVAARVAADLPHVRLVALLRDPVERAYSAYTHEAARGFETLSFEAALDAEAERLAGEEERLVADPAHVSLAHQHLAYQARGHYAEQLRRLEGHVGRDRLCVLDADRFFVDHQAVLAEVLDFLDLDPWQPAHLEQRNARPRSSLDDGVRRRLEEHFEPHDADLAAWWGRTPGWRA